MLSKSKIKERILFWNIRHGGGSRASKIFEVALSYNPTIIIFVEFRNNINGKYFQESLNSKGYSYQYSPETEKNENTILIASKNYFEIQKFQLELLYNHHRTFKALFKEIDLSIFPFYFPQKKEKIPLFDFILNLPDSCLNEKTLLIGDYNTGKHFIDENGATFVAAKKINDMENKGWQDLWRNKNKEKKEFTWYSNKGNGFRVDHAFSSKAVLDCNTSTFYSHKEREDKISDHSLMIIDLDE